MTGTEVTGTEVTGTEVTVDELDLALVNALQLRPRAPWSLLGQTLGISPVTAARRWRRLSEAGIAWVTAYGLPHPEDRGCVAYLDLDCAPDRIGRIADELAEDPHVMSIEHFSQGCDLVVTAAFTDLAAVSRYTAERLGRLPGVDAVRVHLATGFYAEGIRWRLDSLDPAQRVELHDDHLAGNGKPFAARAEVREEDRELLIRLGVDGRLDQAGLAAATGLSPSTLRRRLDRLAASDAIRFRCEIAARDAGRPVLATFRADLPRTGSTRSAPSSPGSPRSGCACPSPARTTSSSRSGSAPSPTSSGWRPRSPAGSRTCGWPSDGCRCAP